MSAASAEEYDWLRRDVAEARARIADAAASGRSVQDAIARARCLRSPLTRCLDLLLWRKRRLYPGCGHGSVTPVESGDETVAALCLSCGEQLPAEWLTCGHTETRTVYADQRVISEPEFGYSERLALVHCPGCKVTWWRPTVFADWKLWL